MALTQMQEAAVALPWSKSGASCLQHGFWAPGSRQLILFVDVGGTSHVPTRTYLLPLFINIRCFSFVK
jgi:hypothetical protein